MLVARSSVDKKASTGLRLPSQPSATPEPKNGKSWSTTGPVAGSARRAKTAVLADCLLSYGTVPEADTNWAIWVSWVNDGVNDMPVACITVLGSSYIGLVRSGSSFSLLFTKTTTKINPSTRATHRTNKTVRYFDMVATVLGAA